MWQKFCKALCDGMEVECASVKVEVVEVLAMWNKSPGLTSEGTYIGLKAFQCQLKCWHPSKCKQPLFPNHSFLCHNTPHFITHSFSSPCSFPPSQTVLCRDLGQHTYLYIISKDPLIRQPLPWNNSPFLQSVASPKEGAVKKEGATIHHASGPSNSL